MAMIERTIWFADELLYPIKTTKKIITKLCRRAKRGLSFIVLPKQNDTTADLSIVKNLMQNN